MTSTIIEVIKLLSPVVVLVVCHSVLWCNLHTGTLYMIYGTPAAPHADYVIVIIIFQKSHILSVLWINDTRIQISDCISLQSKMQLLAERAQRVKPLSVHVNRDSRYNYVGIVRACNQCLGRSTVRVLTFHAKGPGFDPRWCIFFSPPFFFFSSFSFLLLFQAVNRILSRKNREMITSLYSQVLQFEQAAGRK